LIYFLENILPKGDGLSPVLGASISPPDLLGEGAAAAGPPVENWLLNDLVGFNGETPVPPSTVQAKLPERGAELGVVAAVAAAVAPTLDVLFLIEEDVLFKPKAARMLSNLLGFGVPAPDLALREGDASIPSCLEESLASAAMVAARRIERCCSRSFEVIATKPASWAEF
jgi:hypothetical protein